MKEVGSAVTSPYVSSSRAHTRTTKRDRHTVDNSLGIKLECESRKRKRQAGLPCVRMFYDVLEGASHGKLRVSVCWREVLYDDKPGGAWVNANLLF